MIETVFFSDERMIGQVYARSASMRLASAGVSKADKFTACTTARSSNPSDRIKTYNIFRGLSTEMPSYTDLNACKSSNNFAGMSSLFK